MTSRPTHTLGGRGVTSISPVKLVGGFVNGMGKLPCTPVELQDAPNITQDAAIRLAMVLFIPGHGIPGNPGVNFKPAISLGAIDRGAKVDPCQIPQAALRQRMLTNPL